MSKRQSFCDHLNRTKKRDDIKWIVGANDELILIDCPEWSKRHHARIAAENEAERHKFVHRIKHPLNEENPDV